MSEEVVFIRSDLMRRYRVSRPTIKRWLIIGQLPPPDARIAGRDRWRRSTIERFEQRRAGRVVRLRRRKYISARDRESIRRWLDEIGKVKAISIATGATEDSVRELLNCDTSIFDAPTITDEVFVETKNDFKGTRDIKRVTVDTTVQPKNVTFPKLLHAAIKGIVPRPPHP